MTVSGCTLSPCDVQRAATYVPYRDGVFTDRFMADLLNDKHVDAEQTFGCKIFSVSKTTEFLAGWKTLSHA